jgi:hypothetical protein
VREPPVVAGQPLEQHLRAAAKQQVTGDEAFSCKHLASVGGYSACLAAIA